MPHSRYSTFVVTPLSRARCASRLTRCAPTTRCSCSILSLSGRLSLAARLAGRRRILRCSLAAFAVPYLASCGGSGEGTTQPEPQVAVASVTVGPSPSPMTPGDLRKLTATVRDAAGNVLSGRTVTWATTNSSVATVVAGDVQAVAAGAATITATSESKSGSVEVTVNALTTVSFASVVTGGAHSCALTASGAAYCWGRGESGQLGVPSPTTGCPLDSGSFPCSLTPQAVRGGVVFGRLTGGGAHSCGLTSDGSAYCWGSNTSGQLGDNSTTARDLPVPVAGALRFTSIDAGTEHTCGLTAENAAYCWGRNDRGQLGDGTTSLRTVPTRVSGNVSFEFITAGGFRFGHTCALTGSGQAYCWGDNERGQLGIGSVDIGPHPLPATVMGGVPFVELSAGLGRHTCGRTSSGIAHCWGENPFGALGNGSTTNSPVPVQVTGVSTFGQLAVGGFIGHTCAIADGGTAVYCWGDNEVGAIGDGTTEDRFVPTKVVGGLSWTSLDSGFRHTCGRTTSGVLYCWGSNGAGQLGTNSTSPSSVPSKVVGQP
jgi:alpha-tubulin suppressor-like RCC1 family protein